MRKVFLFFIAIYCQNIYSQELFVITECCGGPVVTGCESMTLTQVEEWMSLNNAALEIEAECPDTVKYIFTPVASFNG